MFTSRLITAFLFLAVALPVSADVVEYPDVSFGGNTYTAFQDDTTSLVWLDLDNFLDGVTTYNSLVTLLVGSGYHLATLAELEALQASIPAIPANFTAEAIIVGGNTVGTGTRDLMWGIYEDGNFADGVSYSWKYGGDTFWSFTANSVAPSDVLSLYNSEDQDLGAWIVAGEPANALPVPAMTWQGLALLVTLLAGFAFYHHRRVFA